MTDIQALNAILVQLGGITAYKYNIQAYNAWSVLQGGTGTYTRDIDALNAIDILNGGTGGHRYNIDALNSIDLAAGGTGGHRTDIAALVRLGTLLKLLSFTCAENQTTVGAINEAGSIFEITSGASIFNISALGVITFKVAPDYETQSLYILEVKSSKGKRYKITVNVTEVISTFTLNFGTVLNYNTAI